MGSARWRWTALAAALVLLAPSVESAEKKAERRTLPGGARAVSAEPGTPAADPAVSSAVDRLRAVRGGVGPTAARAARGASGGELILQSRRGHVKTLSASPDQPFFGTRRGTDRSPSGLALSFMREHRVAFGWSRERADLRTRSVRTRGERSFVRFEQRIGNVPVFGAGALVQVEPSGGVSFVLSDLARDESAAHKAGFAEAPVLGAADAQREAVDAVPAERHALDLAAGEPSLMVYEPSVIGNTGTARLVWHVEVRSAAEPVHEVILVDAVTGDVAFQYSRIMDVTAPNRSIYDAANVPDSDGTLVRSEGEGEVGSPDDVNEAYDYLGDTWTFYWNRFTRDSYDGAGGELVARVRYCEGSCPYANAFWDDGEAFFGEYYTQADDVVAHELTHGVTDDESGLIYWGESGAINESLSDIFGEFVDLTNAGGLDTLEVRWKIGEGLPGYPDGIRDMSDPTAIGDPDRRLSPFWYTGSEDNRGVHYNSGVGNKLAYLLTDGDAFNGETVAGQGITDVAELFYEAQVNLLVPGSDYFDLYAALRQAAVNLGWSAAARNALEAACRAVEISPAPQQEIVFSDDFEGSFPGGSWDVIDASATCGPPGSEQPAAQADWGSTTYRAATGSSSLYAGAGGSSPVAEGGPYKSCMDTWVVYGPFSLDSVTDAWAEFDLYLDIEFYGSDADGFADDIFWGVSTDGVTYDGYAVAPADDGCTGECPPTGQPIWVHELFNFREITEQDVLDQPEVWLAFNFASDHMVEYEGAYIDNVEVKKAYDAGLTVTAPNGGEVWPIGSTHPLTWTAQDLTASNSIKLSLVDGATTTEIATVPYDQTSYLWTVAGSATTTARIRVECVGCSGEVSDESDADFEIAAVVDPPPVPSDFNGDDHPDLLWHHQGDGALYLWYLDETVTFDGSYLNPSHFSDTRWQIRGIADFNDDGDQDILWHHQGNGALYVWYMDGTDVTDGTYLNPSHFSDTRWQIRGIADFDDDGVLDILWHHQGNGALYVWYMNGTEAVDGTYLDPSHFSDTRWQIRGVTDMNADGQPDLLWHHQGTGDLYVWFMDGVSVSWGSYLDPSKFADTRWQIRRVQDMNQDGQPDLLWHHQTTGYLYVWLMDGLSVSSGTYLTPDRFSDTRWQITPR